MGESVRELCRADRLGEKHGGVERITTGIGYLGDAMAQVLHLDAGELREGLGEVLRVEAVRELDRELVHRARPVPLEDVDADEVTADFPDPGGDLA
jgi:hypothetical protein